jgi:hypothetical protein
VLRSGDPSGRDRARRPATKAADCQRKEAAGHGDVLLQFYDLIGGGVEEQRGQQAKAEERNRRPARLQAKEQPAVNPVGLHIGGDAGVARDLPGALEDENSSQHRAGKQPERAAQRERKLRSASKARPPTGGAASARVYRTRDSVIPLSRMDARRDRPARVAYTPD